MTRTILFASVTTAATLILALGASAQNGTAEPAAVQAPMSIAGIAAHLEAQGYTILEIEMEHGVYDVELADPNGMRVEAYLDPATGEAMPREFDDDRYDD